MSQSRISILLNDPLFNAKLSEMQELTMQNFLETRATAMEVLQEASVDAAQLVVDAFRLGEVNGKPVGVGLQLNSAFDVLDRTGNKAIEKSLVGTIDLGKLIADAYSEKHGKSEYEKPKPEATDKSFDVLQIGRESESESKSEVSMDE